MKHRFGRMRINIFFFVSFRKGKKATDTKSQSFWLKMGDWTPCCHLIISMICFYCVVACILLFACRWVSVLLLLVLNVDVSGDDGGGVVV